MLYHFYISRFDYLITFNLSDNCIIKNKSIAGVCLAICVPLVAWSQFYETLVLMGKNISCELQNKGLRKLRFLEEADSFPVLLVDAMTICEICSFVSERHPVIHIRTFSHY